MSAVRISKVSGNTEAAVWRFTSFLSLLSSGECSHLLYLSFLLTLSFSSFGRSRIQQQTRQWKKSQISEHQLQNQTPKFCSCRYRKGQSFLCCKIGGRRSSHPGCSILLAETKVSSISQSISVWIFIHQFLSLPIFSWDSHHPWCPEHQQYLLGFLQWCLFWLSLHWRLFIPFHVYHISTHQMSRGSLVDMKIVAILLTNASWLRLYFGFLMIMKFSSLHGLPLGPLTCQQINIPD